MCNFPKIKELKIFIGTQSWFDKDLRVNLGLSVILDL